MIELHYLKKEECQNNLNRIAELLYLNDMAHDYIESCSIDESIVEAKSMCEYIEEGKADVICAFEGDRIVGLIWAFPFMFRDEMRMHIKAMVVDPQYRNNGISQSLLNEIDKAALAKSIEVIDTYVDWSNIKGRGAYEKHGMQPDRILVRKQLSEDM